MILRRLTTLGLASAIAVGQVGEASADAKDFIGGAIIGGVIGHAITKDQQRKRQTVTTTRQVYRPGIASTSEGAQTQTALNYFGYNAGVVDGKVGSGTRRAIEAYQASMGYPVNGSDFHPYQFDFLMQAYYWAQNGGQTQTQLAGQPLLMAYRQKVQSGTLYANSPQPGQTQPFGGSPNQGVMAATAPQTTTVLAPQAGTPAPSFPVLGATPAATAPAFAAPAAAPSFDTGAPEGEPAGAPKFPTFDSGPAEAAPAPAPETGGGQLPTLFAGGAPAPSLATHCNAVMLKNSNNGGYVTLATMTDPDFAMSEQFCLARSHAIAAGEEMMKQIPGASAEQIAQTCDTFGQNLQAQAGRVGAASEADVVAGMQGFAQDSGMSAADLAATSRVCLASGYGRDEMQVALSSAVLLTALGELAYGELVGHHLREGFGAPKRPDLAMGWYNASLTALENGATPVFQPEQGGRPILLREAMVKLQDAAGPVPDADQPSDTAAALPTFKIAQ